MNNNIIDEIKQIDIGSRCRHRTFRNVLVITLKDRYKDDELAEKILSLHENIINDREFRLAVRKEVKLIENKNQKPNCS